MFDLCIYMKRNCNLQNVGLVGVILPAFVIVEFAIVRAVPPVPMTTSVVVINELPVVAATTILLVSAPVNAVFSIPVTTSLETVCVTATPALAVISCIVIVNVHSSSFLLGRYWPLLHNWQSLPVSLLKLPASHGWHRDAAASDDQPNGQFIPVKKREKNEKKLNNLLRLIKHQLFFTYILLNLYQHRLHLYLDDVDQQHNLCKNLHHL